MAHLTPDHIRHTVMANGIRTQKGARDLVHRLDQITQRTPYTLEEVYNCWEYWRAGFFRRKSLSWVLKLCLSVGCSPTTLGAMGVLGGKSDGLR